MTTPPLSQNQRSLQDGELRRSSRIDRAISLIVLGTNRRGEIFQERTAAVSVNLHGCRYSSRHEYAPEGWVTLQVTGTDGANSRPVRARVRSVFNAQNSRELCQVGVELETPGNVWGIPAPPEDWMRLMSANGGSRAAAAAASSGDATHDRQSAQGERRAEVTMFPGPPAAGTAESGTDKDNPPSKAERVVVTADQLLQALQNKLQAAADKAVQNSLSTQLDEAVKLALGKIEEGWKTNVRRSEEFSAARLAEGKTLWENELHAYRDRAEDIARRIEALTSLSQQALSDSQRFVDHFANETAPQLESRFSDAFARANSHLEARASELSSQQQTQLNENVQRSVNEARAQLGDVVAEAHAVVGSIKASNADTVSQTQLEPRLEALRAETLSQLEQRLGEMHASFGQQVEGTNVRLNEITARMDGAALEPRLEALRAEAFDRIEQRLREEHAGFGQQFEATQARLNEVAAQTGGVTLEPRLEALRAETFGRFEQRLGETQSGFEQQIEGTRARLNDVAAQLEGLALESRQARSLHDQGLAEVRSLLTGSDPGISQEQLNGHLNSSREQIMSHLEWRLGEVSAHFEQLAAQTHNRINEVSLQLERLAGETRGHLAEARSLAERSPRVLPQDLTAIEQSVDMATRNFETAAARVSDRHLIRLMEQKQVVAQEASLELEARASETRAMLQKACNNTLDEFRRRVESQVDQILAEAKERVASSMASLDAENRAAVEARRRSLETDVARVAEQSTMEFRSGIKAFLYSCLVAAVSAVDQHAQTTLVGLSNDPNDVTRALEAVTPASPSPEEPQFPPKAATSSQ